MKAPERKKQGSVKPEPGTLTKKADAKAKVACGCKKFGKESPQEGSCASTAVDLTDGNSVANAFEKELKDKLDEMHQHPNMCHNLGKAALTPKERAKKEMGWVNQIVMNVNQAESFLQGQSCFLIRNDSKKVHVDVATKMKMFIQDGPLRGMASHLRGLKMNTDPHNRDALRKDVRDGLVQIGSGLVLCGLYTALIGTGKGRQRHPARPIKLLDEVFGCLKGDNHSLCPCCRQKRDACLKAEACTYFVPRDGHSSGGEEFDFSQGL